jgi:hypothetical protein
MDRWIEGGPRARDGVREYAIEMVREYAMSAVEMVRDENSGDDRRAQIEGKMKHELV